MKDEIRPVRAIIAQLLLFGIKEVGYRHVNEIEPKVRAIFPSDSYRLIVESINTTDNGFMRGINTSYVFFIRGWCSGTKEEISAVIKNRLRGTPLLNEFMDKLEESVDVEAIFRQVFTQEYVTGNFTCDIPEQYREQFIQICREFAEQELALANVSS